MQESTLKVEGMSCEHCVAAVKNAVEPLLGVDSVAVDLATKTVTVTHDPAQTPLTAIAATIEDQGFEVIG